MIMCKTKVITKNKKADVCTLSLRLEDTDNRRDDGKTADVCTLSLWLEDAVVETTEKLLVAVH